MKKRSLARRPHGPASGFIRTGWDPGACVRTRSAHFGEPCGEPMTLKTAI
jgi:hypothetical protein